MKSYLLKILSIIVLTEGFKLVN
ncbi:hypothetical protein NTGM5_680060 [Candidatus Nitrotoga sp. M5]|nr:hypothetical protein NTGM5_680060 [Candidatus Nitrotoga sp. M5]